jgi:Putative DNA-binding domain
MNSPGGGKLLVGVDDKGAICGIQRDFETFNKKNWDGWLQHFTNLIDNHIIGKNVMTCIKPRPIAVEGNLIALIEVRKGSREVYIYLFLDRS